MVKVLALDGSREVLFLAGVPGLLISSKEQFVRMREGVKVHRPVLPSC